MPTKPRTMMTMPLQQRMETIARPYASGSWTQEPPSTFYVDDLIILASNVNILKWLKSRLEDEFEMSDLGELHYCLDVEFERDRANHTITMSQRKYIEEVLKRFNMEECKPIGTPLDVNSKLLN